MGFLGQTIISPMNRLTDIWHATIGATIPQSYRQLRLLSPPARVKGLVLLRHTRQGLNRFVRALMLSRLDGTHEVEHRSLGAASRQMTLPLRLAVDHTTKHGQIGP